MRIACGQLIATTMDEAASVWAAIARMAARAAAARADLLVLPEVAYPAYWLESEDRYRRDDIERTTSVIARLSAIAASHRFWLVAGIVEESEGRLFNGAAVFDREGRLVGIARKNFLWDCDNRWFAAGDDIRVFETEFGRMGVLICADGRAPEITATLVARGAAFCVMPTAWVNSIPWSGQFRNAQADFIIRARAAEFGVPFTCADKAGAEGRFLEYVGQSQIVDSDGTVVQRASIEGEDLIVADVLPRQAAPACRIVSPELLGRLRRQPRDCSRTTPAPTIDIDPSWDAVTVAQRVMRAGGKAALIHASVLRHFHEARAAALDGVQVIVAHSDVLPEWFVQTRAAENRIFCILTGATGTRNGIQLVADPTGQIVFRAGDQSRPISLDLSPADDKRFTPDTHLWEQRRVGCYQLG